MIWGLGQSLIPNPHYLINFKNSNDYINYLLINNIYEFKKRSIDKTCNDNKNKFYKPMFRIDVHFSDV